MNTYLYDNRKLRKPDEIVSDLFDEDILKIYLNIKGSIFIVLTFHNEQHDVGR